MSRSRFGGTVGGPGAMVGQDLCATSTWSCQLVQLGSGGGLGLPHEGIEAPGGHHHGVGGKHPAQVSMAK